MVEHEHFYLFVRNVNSIRKSLGTFSWCLEDKIAHLKYYFKQVVTEGKGKCWRNEWRCFSNDRVSHRRFYPFPVNLYVFKNTVETSFSQRPNENQNSVPLKAVSLCELLRKDQIKLLHLTWAGLLNGLSWNILLFSYRLRAVQRKCKLITHTHTHTHTEHAYKHTLSYTHSHIVTHTRTIYTHYHRHIHTYYHT